MADMQNTLLGEMAWCCTGRGDAMQIKAVELFQEFGTAGFRWHADYWDLD